MNLKNQMGILSLNDVAFSRKSNVGSMIIKNFRFAYVIISGFDPHLIVVGDLVIGIMHSRFFMKATIWIKTRERSNGRQWTIIQTQETKFFCTILWPFTNH
jgi:hypothetical protein